MASALSLINPLILLALFFEPAPCRPITIPDTIVTFMARNRLPLTGIFLLLSLLAAVGISRLNTGSLILDFFEENASCARIINTLKTQVWA